MQSARRYIYPHNYEKHAPRVSQVIAAVAKVSCKHGLWLVTHVNNMPQKISIVAEWSIYEKIRFRNHETPSY